MEDSASGSLYRKPRDMNVIGGGLLNESDYYDYTDYETVDLREETPSEAVWIPLVYSVVVIVGLLGNGLLLLVLIRRRRFWRPSDTFVLQLGVVDILLLVTLIIWAIRANQKCVHCSVTLFKICRAVWNINFYVGMFLLVCICLENLLVKVRSDWFSQHGAGFSVTCYSLTWLLSVILAVLDWCLFPSNSSKEMPIYVHEHSGVGFDKLLALRLIHLLIGFLVPLLILIIWCAHTFLQRRQNKTSAILALVTVFLVCWIPYNITLILDTIYYGSSHFLKKVPIDPEASLKTALTVTSAMGSVHACLRPLLYFLFRPNFRKSVLSVLRCSSPQRMTSLWELGVSQNDEEHSEERQKQMEMLQQRQEAA
uniref:G-protein coupled receptors family 1 profile domain-containing protein n=1 Tax=Nothobranchius kadleci TaxID=1051664 RepID=A0A1A8D2I1_NOTKA